MTTPAALAASGSSFASPYSGSKLLDSGHALSQAVREALQTLEATSREIVMLVHGEGLSLADVARLLRINESTARTKYGRARTKLRDELKVHDFLVRNEDQLSHGSERHA